MNFGECKKLAVRLKFFDWLQLTKLESIQVSADMLSLAVLPLTSVLFYVVFVADGKPIKTAGIVGGATVKPGIYCLSPLPHRPLVCV